MTSNNMRAILSVVMKSPTEFAFVYRAKRNRDDDAERCVKRQLAHNQISVENCLVQSPAEQDRSRHPPEHQLDALQEAAARLRSLRGSRARPRRLEHFGPQAQGGLSRQDEEHVKALTADPANANISARVQLEKAYKRYQADTAGAFDAKSMGAGAGEHLPENRTLTEATI
jgi:hypothetical protein